MKNTLVKSPIVFFIVFLGGGAVDLEGQIYPSLSLSAPFKQGSPEVQNILIKIPIVCGGDWLDLQGQI